MTGSPLLLALLLSGAQAMPPHGGQDVTVTARKRPLKPVVDAFGYFERHCFDASRLTGQPSTPYADPDWHELTSAERQRFGLEGKDDIAFGIRRPDGQVLALTLARTTQGDLIEHRCTLIVLGGEQGRVPNQIATLMRGPGTQKHVGHRDGVARAPGWRQLLWTAIPSIGSPNWQVFNMDRSVDSWVRITEPSFYARAEYVVVDLRMREAGPPLSVVQLVYTRRRDRRVDDQD